MRGDIDANEPPKWNSSLLDVYMLAVKEQNMVQKLRENIWMEPLSWPSLIWPVAVETEI